SLRLMGGASDGCRPKLHRWPFSLRHSVLLVTPRRVAPSFLQQGQQKRHVQPRPPGGACRLVPAPRECSRAHRQKRRGRGRSQHPRACQAAYQIYSTRSGPRAQALFLAPEGREPVYFLCAIACSAASPWKISTMQGAKARPGAEQRRCGSLHSSPPCTCWCSWAFVPEGADQTPLLGRLVWPDTHGMFRTPSATMYQNEPTGGGAARRTALLAGGSGRVPLRCGALIGFQGLMLQHSPRN